MQKFQDGRSPVHVEPRAAEEVRLPAAQREAPSAFRKLPEIKGAQFGAGIEFPREGYRIVVRPAHGSSYEFTPLGEKDLAAEVQAVGRLERGRSPDGTRVMRFRLDSDFAGEVRVIHAGKEVRLSSMRHADAELVLPKRPGAG